MSEPMDVSKAFEYLQKKMEENRQRYKEAYIRYGVLKNKECYCDRMSCARCLEMENLKNQLSDLLYG